MQNTKKAKLFSCSLSGECLMYPALGWCNILDKSGCYDFILSKERKSYATVGQRQKMTGREDMLGGRERRIGRNVG